MSQHSEDRLEESAPKSADLRSARILPFERPQSDLQRAVQERAQEAMKLERDRDREANKGAPLRWIIVMAIALIPVILLFSAVDAFVRVFQQINLNYSTAPAPQQQQEPVGASETAQPGVVLLQPLDASPPAADAQGDERSSGETTRD